MSKYNNYESIPIDSLKEEELKTAIKEWAEGSPAMEELLWTFYHSGIKTNGCHAEARPFIGFNYDPQEKEKISRLMDAALSIKGSNISISPDGGNPFSGKDWYKPTITLGFNDETKEEVEQHLQYLTYILKNDQTMIENTRTSSILELLDFLINKYSALTIFITHTEDEKYEIAVEGKTKMKKEKHDILKHVFEPIGLEEKEVGPRYCWEHSYHDMDELEQGIKKVSSHIIDNYTFQTPTKEEECEKFNTIAHLKRKESLEKTGKLDEFNKWLMVEEEKLNQDMNQAKIEKDNNKQKE